MASAILAFASAIPVTQQQQGGFTIEQVPNPSYVASGPRAMLKALNKYGVTERASKVHSAIAATGSGSVTATPEQYDSEYLCPVTAGTQTFKLDFDTGSSDL